MGGFQESRRIQLSFDETRFERHLKLSNGSLVLRVTAGKPILVVATLFAQRKQELSLAFVCCKVFATCVEL